MRTIRGIAIALATALGVGLGLSPAVASEVSPAAVEAELSARINAARVHAGMEPLAVDHELRKSALLHVERMVAAGEIFHAPGLGREVSSWEVLGENVGVTAVSPGVAVRLHDAFMESPSHRRNVLDRRFTQAGIAAVVASDGVYVVQRFRLPTVASEPADGHLHAASASVADEASRGTDTFEDGVTSGTDPASDAVPAPAVSAAELPQPYAVQAVGTASEVAVLGAHVDLRNNSGPARPTRPFLPLGAALLLFVDVWALAHLVSGRSARRTSSLPPGCPALS